MGKSEINGPLMLVPCMIEASKLLSAGAENLISHVKAELSDIEVFPNVADAQIKLAIFRRFYNE